MSREEAKRRAEDFYDIYIKRKLRMFVNKVMRWDSRNQCEYKQLSRNHVEWMRVAANTGQELIVDKTSNANKWITKIVFGSRGVGGFLLNMLFSLMEDKEPNVSIDDIERRLRTVVGEHMSNERLADVKGAMENIAQIVLIDSYNTDFTELLKTKIVDLRLSLNALSIAIRNGGEYCTLEILQAFMMGQNMLCTTYSTIHHLDERKVAAKSLEEQVENSKVKMKETCKSFVEGVFAKFTVQTRPSSGANIHLYFVNGELEENSWRHVDDATFIEELNVVMKAELAKYYTEIISDMENKLPKTMVVDGKLYAEVNNDPFIPCVFVPDEFVPGQYFLTNPIPHIRL